MDGPAVTNSRELRQGPQSYHRPTLRYFVDALPHLAWVADAEGALTYCNARWLEYTGLSLENAPQGGLWKQVVMPEDWASFESWYAAVLSGQEVKSVEVRMRGKKTPAAPRWFLLHVAPVDTGSGGVAWVGTATDITEQKNYAESLSAAEKKYSALFNSNIVGIVVSGMGQSDRILEANDVFLRMIGYTRDDLKRQSITWAMLTPEHYTDLEEEKVRDVIRQGSIVPLEKVYIRKDGSEVPVLVGAAKLQPESTVGVNFVLDISQQKALERRKDEFMGMASHELKTPLSVQKLYLHMLSKEAEQLEDHQTISTLIQKTTAQTEKLSSIIGDMLDLSRIEAGKVVLRKTRFDPNALVREIVEEAALVHGKENIEVRGSVDGMIFADRDRLGQVFTNLLSNAVKYAPNDKPVIVHLGRRGDRAHFCVQDFGIGIDEKDLENIFSRFFRVEGSSERTYPGMGVGLFIASDIVKRHGGQIWVESQKGSGSSFYFELPLADSGTTNDYAAT